MLGDKGIESAMTMPWPKATPATAGIAGAWLGLGMQSIENWRDAHPLPAGSHDVLFFSGLLVFFLVPALLLVFGAHYLKVALPWPQSLFTQAYWTEMKAIFLRALCWLFGAAAAGSLVSLLS
jgi:hypothetical protein